MIEYLGKQGCAKGAAALDTFRELFPPFFIALLNDYTGAAPVEGLVSVFRLRIAYSIQRVACSGPGN